MPQLKLHVLRKYLKVIFNKHLIALIWSGNVLGNGSLDIICSSKLTVFLELCSQKTVCFSEQIMSKDKYLITFLRQTKAGGGTFRDELLVLRFAKWNPYYRYLK